MRVGYEKLKKQRDRLVEFVKEVSETDCNEIDGHWCLPCLAKQILKEVGNGG